MQASAAEVPFSNNEYFFEVKWEGLRCLLFLTPEGEVRLQDRARPAEPVLAPGEGRQVGPLRGGGLDRALRGSLRRTGGRLLRVGPAPSLRNRGWRLRALGQSRAEQAAARAGRRGQPA